VVTDEELKDRLRAELPGIYRLRRAILDSPLLRTLLTPFVDGYTRAYLRDGEYGRRVGDLLDRLQGGEDLAFYDAPVLILVHSREQIPTPKEDSVLVAYNVVLMAQALGLGTCIVTLAQNAINSSARCKAMLGLSPQDRVHAVVVMGYPAVRYRRAVPRQAKAATWLSG
jgi:nitroreductase